MNGAATPQYRVPFSGVGYRYGEDEIAIVSKAMDATGTLTQGSYQTEFEANFGEYLGIENCFATTSAASALELAAILTGVGPGDEVIIPAHTYNASAYPFARRGVAIRWADIDPVTFVMSAESVAALITPRTKVVVAVHLYGLPVDMGPLMEVTSSRGIIIVEDCAQSIGARYREQLTGSLGDISIFSFHSHKNISTLGEGGLIAVRSKALAAHVPGLRHNGHRPFARSDDRYWHPAMSDVAADIPGEWPHNFCMGEVQAALGSHLLKKVGSINDKRRDRYLQAAQAFADLPEIQLQAIPTDRTSSHHLLPFWYHGEQFGHSNHDFIRELAFKRGIQPATQYYPLYRYSLFRDFGYGEADVPVTDAFFDNMVSLPFHVWMPDDDFAYVLEQVRDVAIDFRGN